MTDCIDADGFRANVGIILLNDQGMVFLGGRAGRRGWQFPQGGICRGETPQQAMYRELHEEIGLRAEDVELLGSTRDWVRYRLPKQYQRKHSSPLCVGQKQRWFLLRLVKNGNRFRFDHTEEPEFDRWRWVKYWRPVREVIFFKREVYLLALRELGPIGFPDGVPRRPRWLTEQEQG